MQNVNNPIIIVPYLFENEIQELKKAIGWKIDAGKGKKHL